jgi:hypothetical protein
MQKFAIRDYTATPGNRGAWCLHRTGGDVTHFLDLTFWDDFDAIKRFAGGRLQPRKVLRLRSRVLDRDGTTRAALRNRVTHLHLRGQKNQS